VDIFFYQQVIIGIKSHFESANKRNMRYCRDPKET